MSLGLRSELSKGKILPLLATLYLVPLVGFLGKVVSCYALSWRGFLVLWVLNVFFFLPFPFS